YGFQVIGAVQPSDFSDPSPREVARVIDQIRKEKVPAVFGSEVFPSPVLEQIARETKSRYIDKLRDDELPGRPGDPQHSYIGMMVENMTIMFEALGGSTKALKKVDSVPVAGAHDSRDDSRDRRKGAVTRSRTESILYGTNGLCSPARNHRLEFPDHGRGSHLNGIL